MKLSNIQIQKYTIIQIQPGSKLQIAQTCVNKHHLYSRVKDHNMHWPYFNSYDILCFQFAKCNKDEAAKPKPPKPGWNGEGGWAKVGKSWAKVG